MPEASQSAVTAEQFLAIVHANMPSTSDLDVTVLELLHGRAKIRVAYDARTVRAGGSIAGPTIFALADLALYAATMTIIGAEALTVTTDLTIHFLSKARNEALVADARIVRAGKMIAVGSVDIATESGKAIAHAVGSYAIPPARTP